MFLLREEKKNQKKLIVSHNSDKFIFYRKMRSSDIPLSSCRQQPRAVSYYPLVSSYIP